MRSINPHFKHRRAKRTAAKVTGMARRRFKASRRRSGGRDAFGGLIKPVIGGVTYSVASPFITQLTNNLKLGISDEIAQIGAGLVIKGTQLKKLPFASSLADAMIYINVAKLSAGFTKQLNLGGVASSAPPAAPTNNLL